ncbi:hypothetical protein NN561_003113 [Cricetulus griseus]
MDPLPARRPGREESECLRRRPRRGRRGDSGKGPRRSALRAAGCGAPPPPGFTQWVVADTSGRGIAPGCKLHSLTHALLTPGEPAGFRVPQINHLKGQ